MTPPLAVADRQTRWAPTWVLECAEFPHVYAGRDISLPAIGGAPFTTGDSETGGADLVGGGAGADALHAWGRIIGAPTVTRRISDPLWQLVEIQDVTVTIADPDGALLGDFRAAPFTLSRYDAVSGLRLSEWTGLIDRTSRNRGAVTITGSTVDTAWLEERVPGGAIDAVTFPYADPSALGQTFRWVFGNVRNLALPNIADNQIDSVFDYGLSSGDVAALLALRRLGRNPDDPSQATFTIGIDELEPYPGQDGVLVNGTMEDWDAGAAVAPTGWTLFGAGATVAKNTTAGQVDEGDASASLTRVGTDCRLEQNLIPNAPTLPLAWWRTREISVTVRVRATVAATVFLRVSDGVALQDSTFHTGGGLFEDLTVGTVTVPFLVNAAATICTIRLVVGTTNQTAQFDRVRVYLRAKNWEEIPRPDLYDGATAIRFFLRQEDASGALYPIVADLNGAQPERNPVRAARTLLSDATRGAGRTVDTASFDAAEIAACLTYEDMVRLHAPELFLPLRDVFRTVADQTIVIKDRSGHERHALYDKSAASEIEIYSGDDGRGGENGPSGDGNDAYIANTADGGWTAVPDHPAFSGQTISMEIWIAITDFVMSPGVAVPIMEKLVGTAAQTGYALYRQDDEIRFGVRGADATWYTAACPMGAVPPDLEWIRLIGEVEANGAVRLYRGVGAAAPTLQDTTSFPTTVAVGSGEVLIGKWGTGIAVDGEDFWTKAALYRTILTDAQKAAISAGIARAVEPIGKYAITAAVFSYLCAEASGDTVMHDQTAAHHGAWVGAPTLGVADGPLNPERGLLNSYGGARFVNSVAQYGVETGMTLAHAEFTVGAFYRPSALSAKSGVFEKTIAGVRGTQWGLCQFGAVVRFTMVTTAGTFTVDAPVLAEDVGRWGLYIGQYRTSGGLLRVFKNSGIPAATAIIAGTPVSGVGDFYVGIQGTAGAGRTRPARGDIGRVWHVPSFLTKAQIEELLLAATWYNGGLCVDVALREPRQAQEYIKQFALLADLRLGATATGAITAAVGLANPPTVQVAARDGVGDGERNIVRIAGRATPSLKDTVRDLVLRYRPELQSGEWLRALRREVSTRTDAQGRRIGKKKVLTLECVREDPTADRVLDRLRKRMKAADDRVAVTLHQEARRLMEGHLVAVTDALMGYAGEVLEARQVDKALETIAADLVGWDEAATTYEPGAFTSGAAPG